MTLVAMLVALLLGAIALVHVYWGFGGVWPGTDEKSCARAIAGFKGIDRMPPASASFAVAMALTVTLFIALDLAGQLALPLPSWLVRISGFAAAMVFLARGIAGYTPAWRKLTPEMPFAHNDTRYFSPLCMVIGTALIVLVMQSPVP